MNTTFNVLLYYKFIHIDDPESDAAEHRALCARLNLKGRVLFAPEGINGTVSGTVEECREYMDAMHADPRFSDVWFKIDEVDGHVFDKMFVRVKNELVTLRSEHDLDPTRKTGRHLAPKEWFDMMQREDAIVVDGRTDYEFDLGHFRGAVRPDVSSFREFPTWIEQHLGDVRDRPILTYCTGGIRCEKLTALLLEEGFTNVYQLDGGIVSYGKDPSTQGALWDGQCYVFDKRISVEINHTADRRIVGRCSHCGAPTEHYVNCANLDCHKQHLSCPACEQRMQRSCSEACMTAPRREVLA